METQKQNICWEDECIVKLKIGIARVEEKIKANEVAQNLASDNLKVRLDSLNEWRLQNKDERSNFMTRDYYEVRHQELQKQVDDLRLSRAALEGRASMNSVYVAYLFSAIGIIIGIIDLIRQITK